MLNNTLSLYMDSFCSNDKVLHELARRCHVAAEVPNLSNATVHIYNMVLPLAQAWIHVVSCPLLQLTTCK